MNRLSTVAFVASTFVASLAYAERPYESTKPDSSADRPVLTIHHESFKPDVRPNARGELVLPAKDDSFDAKSGKPMLRPDAKRDAFVPVDESTGHTRGVRANQETQKGKPNLRHDAKREAFMPADEDGRARKVNSNREVQKGKPNLRPDAKRDAFQPTDENTGLKRGLNSNKDMKPAFGDKAQEMSHRMVCSFALCD